MSSCARRKRSYAWSSGSRDGGGARFAIGEEGSSFNGPFNAKFPGGALIAGAVASCACETDEPARTIVTAINISDLNAFIIHPLVSRSGRSLAGRFGFSRKCAETLSLQRFEHRDFVAGIEFITLHAHPPDFLRQRVL